MAKYSVAVPFSGVMHTEVEADSEEAAVSAAVDLVSLDDVESWEAVPRLVYGNVFCGMLREAEADKVGD